jgi:hypothetical protein
VPHNLTDTSEEHNSHAALTAAAAAAAPTAAAAAAAAHRKHHVPRQLPHAYSALLGCLQDAPLALLLLLLLLPPPPHTTHLVCHVLCQLPHALVRYIQRHISRQRLKASTRLQHTHRPLPALHHTCSSAANQIMRLSVGQHYL